MEMELAKTEDIVIVGAGIAGLTTALALHRVGIRSLVLESAESLRASGFAYTSWSNAWKAFDAIGIADSLRENHPRLHGYVATSAVTARNVELSFTNNGKEEIEVRCTKRQVMVETLAKELPIDSIKFSSKVAYIEESGNFKLLYLNDGTFIKTKVLIGCDGANSVVANWLGFKKPIDTGRESIRGFAVFHQKHGFDSKIMQFYGDGYRCGFVPCDDTTIYWFFTWSSSITDEKLQDINPMKRKQFVLSKLEKQVFHQMRMVVENTEAKNTIHANLKYRNPWELVWKNISKGNTCVAGDALHAMTPDISQGGCSALEDGVVLARCLSEALMGKLSGKEEYERIEIGLNKYAQLRKWRSFDLVTTSYLVGYIQQTSGKLLSFFRDHFLAKFLAGLLLKKSNFDCGKLTLAS